MSDKELNQKNEQNTNKDDVLELVVDNGEKPSYGIFGLIALAVSLIAIILVGWLYMAFQTKVESLNVEDQLAQNQQLVKETQEKLSASELKYEKLFNENKEKIDSLGEENRQLQEKIDSLMQNEKEIGEPVVEVVEKKCEEENSDDCYRIKKPKIPASDTQIPTIPEVTNDVSMPSEVAPVPALN